MSAERRGLESLNLPDDILRVLEGFILKARRLLGDVEIYLFGSYARGNWLKDSDLDLIVVSPRFSDMELGERYRLVRSLLPSNLSVELLLYTPDEFEKVRKRSIIIQDISEYWIRLA